MSEWKAYELGVADAVRHRVGGSASVEHDVRIRGRSGTLRQIDIAVRGPMFGLGDALLVVECKDHERPIDVGVVDGFVGIVDDVGADLGVLVTRSGITETARARAGQKRIRVHVLDRSELDRWSPPGTRSAMFAVPAEQTDSATAALVKAGYRVRRRDDGMSDGEVQVEAYRLAEPDDDTFAERARSALTDAGVRARATGSATSFAGGTPSHRWIPVYLPGGDVPLKVLAADEEELRAAVLRLGEQLGVDPAVLDPRPPDGWPFPSAL